MIYRHMYQGFHENEEVTIINEELIENCSISVHKNKMYLYFESKTENLQPEQFIKVNLKPFPDGSNWNRLINIFHYSAPQSEEHWKRDKKKDPFIKVIYLKDDMVASYIFYHYQLQEEHPGCGDKYGTIYLDRNMLVFYFEEPREKETIKLKGKFDSNNTPPNWSELMRPHFMEYDDCPADFMNIKTTYSLYR